MPTARRSLLVVLLIALSTASSLYAAWPSGYDPRYVRAVADTQLPLTSDRVSDNLTTIRANDHIRSVQLDKDGIPHDTVLMSNFGDWGGYSRAYDGTKEYRPKLWTAVAPEMWQFFQTNNVAPRDMSLRAKQLMGLPTTSGAYYVMECWVRPESLFRPAMNPDIANPVTSLTFQGAMADPASDMRKWYDAQFSTYTANPPYPWTRAGYTYDWGIDVMPNIGLTEFMADNQNLHPDPQKAWETYKVNPIWVRSVISLVSYKYYVRESDSFNVTDYCDTIWIGSRYLPVTPNGNTPRPCLVLYTVQR